MIEKLWDPRTARVLSTALIFALGLLFLSTSRDTLTLFLFAILFAYLVAPLVARLEKPLRGRIQAIAGVYLILTGVLVGVGLMVGPRVVAEGRSLAASLPSLLDKTGSDQLISQLGNSHGWSIAKQVRLQKFLVAHRDDILAYVRTVAQRLAEPAQHIWWLILIPILSVFFLKDGRDMAQGIIDQGKRGTDRRTLRGIVSDVNVMLGSYIRAQLILAGLTLIAYTAVLSLMRVPYAFVLGPLAGIFEFVPVVGPAVAAASVVAIAVLAGYSHLVWLVVFLGVWRLLQDYVSGPRIMGESLEISPLAQIFAVLAGGEIGGVVGALVSVPVVATLRILWDRLSSKKGFDEPLTPISPTLSETT